MLKHNRRINSENWKLICENLWRNKIEQNERFPLVVREHLIEYRPHNTKSKKKVNESKSKSGEE